MNRTLVPSLVLLLTLTACAGSDRVAAPPAPPLTAAATVPSDFAYPAGDTVRVVTWNVEHFVDDIDDPYIDNDRENEPRDVARRTALLADALRAMDADVVVLQEFESAAFAQRIADEVVPELGYRFVAGTESPDWYQNVVLLSRLPLGVVRSYAAVTTPVEGERDDEGRPATQSLTNNRLWTADVLARPGYPLVVAGLHLKAGGGDRNAGWRRGQIRFLKNEFARLLALDPAANIVVAGDFNATPESDEMRLFLAPAAPVVLVDPLADSGALTHPTEAPTRRIDYVLVNDGALSELVPGSARVLRPLAPDAMAEISDHLPVGIALVARAE